jgi:hypothetical protein
MLTGYTADVKDGKVTEFADFALQCARAFGALVSMREDLRDAPIPDEFQPREYHSEALAKAEADMARLQAMSTDEIATWANAEQDARAEREAQWESDKTADRQRYEDMLEKVNAWTPPTPDHAGMKTFMVEQLQGSIKFDCDFPSKNTERVPPIDFYAEAVARAQKDIEYHQTEYAAEVAYCAERSQWVRDLKASL